MSIDKKIKAGIIIVITKVKKKKKLNIKCPLKILIFRIKKIIIIFSLFNFNPEAGFGWLTVLKSAVS